MTDLPILTYAPKHKPVLTKDEVRSIFLANGFKIKEGQTDLMAYVYQAARCLEQHVLELRPVGASEIQVCRDCGSTEGFTDVTHHEGDHDCQCNKCGSMHTDCLSDAISFWVNALDELQAKVSECTARDMPYPAEAADCAPQ